MELEKEKGKASAKPDPRPSPKAQALLNQEQQKKKKRQQQQKQQQEVAKSAQPVPQNKPSQPNSAKASGASHPSKSTQAASGTPSTTSDKQVVAIKKVSTTPSAIRFGQALSNPRAPSSDKLETAEQFIKAWNAADLPEGSSTSASPHSAGPSRMFQSLHSVETSVAEAKRVFEVTLPNLLLFYFDMIKLHYSQSPRFGSND